MKPGWVKRYAPGHENYNPLPGDFILTHRRRPYSWIIAHGQRLRFKGVDRPYAHWSHAALVVGEDGSLVEALGQGVVENHISAYRRVEYHYVNTGMDSHDRDQAATFARACIGERYGWSIIAGLSLVVLTGSSLQFGFNGTEICSGLVARALERGPFIFPKAPNTMMPGDLAAYFKICP